MNLVPAADRPDRPAGEPKATFTITELADEFAVTPRAIRFYEDKGLLAPQRHGLHRIYGRRDRARLMLILRGKRLGFTLAEVGEMLDLYDLGDGQSEQMRYALRKGQERLAMLERQRRDLDDAIAELREMTGSLERALRQREAGPG
ncbi:MAG: MerR family DNA-binding transcriptional regulator [Alphaproteobacteria bacterium]|nr:MerR family DNA-binding transcriptional regulator [Alphaproteobacteria bacterium]